MTPKYMRKFALNPPCPRAPLAPGQVADPTSIKCGEDFPEEWAKRQAKLARQAKEAVKKFNEDSATATATEASVKPRKSMPKKPARKPSASPTVPSRQIPHTATAPPKSSRAASKSSAPVHLATCQRTAGFSIASGVSASSSAAPISSSGPTLLKTKATAGRGPRPSPKKKQVAFHVPSDDEASDDELAEIIRDRQVKAARAKGTSVPLLLDPRKILDYIDLWHKDPNTPMPDFHLTAGQNHMLTHFITEEKWKFEKAREIKKAQYRKEKLLKKNVVRMTPEELLQAQSEIQALSKDF